MFLCDGSGQTEQRFISNRRIRDLWLESDPGTCVDRQNRVNTSLFPKSGQYIMPIKASVRQAENLEQGDTVTVRLKVR